MKKSTSIIILAVVLAGGFYAYKERLGKKSVNNSGDALIEAETSNQKETTDTQGNGIKSLINAQESVDYIAYNIINISPEKAVLGGAWYVTRVWVVEDTAETQNIQAYAEYEDGHIMRKVLVEIYVGGEETAHKVEALFEPGEADWKLIQGEDIAFGKSLLLYEKDDTIGEWTKK